MVSGYLRWRRSLHSVRTGIGWATRIRDLAASACIGAQALPLGGPTPAYLDAERWVRLATRKQSTGARGVIALASLSPASALLEKPGCPTARTGRVQQCLSLGLVLRG